MTDKLAAALDLARRGLRVFPLIDGGKTPAFAGWQDVATTDIPTLTGWFSGQHKNANLGVATGRGLMVVDADAKNGGHGVQSLELMEMLGADLEFVVVTPTKGRHAYFRLPDGIKVPNSVRAMMGYPDIDIRGEGGLVVGPGSETPNGAYEILRDGQIPESQAWLTEAAQKAKKLRTKSSAEPAAELDTPQSVDRAIFYLTNNAPLAIEGARGDDTTYRVVAHIKDYGVSDVTALSLLLEHWNERCSPPWEPDDLEGKVASAYKSGTSAPGNKSAAAEFGVVDLDAAAEDDKLHLDFVRPIAFGVEQPPHREWAVEGWIPAGKTTLLSGDGGVGKTLAAQQLLTAVAVEDAEWFGRKVKHGPVLGVFSEDDTNEMWRRQIDVCRAMDVQMSELSNVNWWTLDTVAAGGCVLMSFTRENPEGKLGTFYRKLDAALTRLKPVMVVLDPVANMFGGNELDRAQVTGFVNRTLNRLCTKHGCTMVVLVHPSLSGMAEGSGRSGSTSWANAVRSRLYLTRPKNDPVGDYRELRPTKNNYGKLDDAVLLRWNQGAFVPAAPGGDTDPDRVTDLSLLAALRTLTERGEVLSTATRAGNYAVRRAMALPEVDGMMRTALEESLERLLRSGAVWIGSAKDPWGRDQQKLFVAANTADEFEQAEDPGD